MLGLFSRIIHLILHYGALCRRSNWGVLAPYLHRNGLLSQVTSELPSRLDLNPGESQLTEVYETDGQLRVSGQKTHL